MSTLNRPAAFLLAALAPLAAAAAPVSFTDQFPIRACDFKPFGGNPFLKLTVGRQLYYSNPKRA